MAGRWPRLRPRLSHEFRSTLGGMQRLWLWNWSPKFQLLDGNAARSFTQVFPRLLVLSPAFRGGNGDINGSYFCLVFFSIRFLLSSDPNKWKRPDGHLLSLPLLESSNICPNNSSVHACATWTSWHAQGFLSQIVTLLRSAVVAEGLASDSQFSEHLKNANKSQL